MERIGGAIRLKSDGVKGTTFELDFPTGTKSQKLGE